MCDEHKHTLAAHLVELQQSIDEELVQHAEQLRERLLCHFAEAIVKCCSGLHNDNRKLTKLWQHAHRHGHGSDIKGGDWMSLRNAANDTNLQDVPPLNSDSAHSDSVSEREEDHISVEGANRRSRSGADEPLVIPDKNKSIRRAASSETELPPTESKSSRFVDKVFSSSDRYAAGFEKGMLPAHGCIGCLSRFVCSRFFEGFFNFLIVFNCITMGLESQQAVNGYFSDFGKAFIIVSEHVLTSLFTLELCLKLRVFGWKIFIPWNRGHMNEDGMGNFVDAILVLFTGVIFLWILPFVAAIAGFSEDSSLIRTLSVLRAVRLLRLVRVLRGVPFVREAWILLRGLADSVRTLFWTCVVLAFITYIFAVFGMALISKELVDRRNASDNVEMRASLSELLEYVGGINLWMYTLFQVLTLDSWNGIMRPMQKELPWCWMYFYAYIAVAVFVLMNLVTAIIVDNAVAHTRQDEADKLKSREHTKNAELQKLERLFKLMDTDGSGTINWQEFSDAFEDPAIADKWRLLDIDPDECMELFQLLDDGDGEIATQEFFDGLKKMKGVAQSKDIFRVQKDLNHLAETLKGRSRASSQEGSHKDDERYGNVDRDMSGLAKDEHHGRLAIDKNRNGLSVMVKNRFNTVSSRRTDTAVRLLDHERVDNSARHPSLAC